MAIGYDCKSRCMLCPVGIPNLQREVSLLGAARGGHHQSEMPRRCDCAIQNTLEKPADVRPDTTFDRRITLQTLDNSEAKLFCPSPCVHTCCMHALCLSRSLCATQACIEHAQQRAKKVRDLNICRDSPLYVCCSEALQRSASCLKSWFHCIC